MLEIENNDNPLKDKGYKPKSSDEIFNDIYKDKENLTPAYKPGIGTNIDITKATEELGLENRPELGTQFLQERMKQIESQKIYDTAKKKADEQGFFGELVGFTAQVAAGAVGGTLEGLGALFDPTMIDTMEADSQSFGKMLSDWGTKLRELGTEYGVQVNPEAKESGFAPWSREWWLSGTADATGSVLGFLIPVAAEAKALSAAGTALQGINALGKAGKFGNAARKGFNLIDDIIAKAPELTATESWAVDGIHKAIVSRHMESTMEAKQVFDEEYKKFVDAGKSEQEARSLAAESAAFTYRGNWGMLVSDIPQYLLMLRGPKLSKVIDDAKLAKVAGTSEGLAKIEGVKKYLLGIGSEAGEEAYQFIISEEAKHSADVKAGLVEDNDFSERMGKYSKDANLWSAALFGGLGGGVFQAAGPKVMEGVNKYLLKNSTEKFDETTNRIAEFTSRKETILKNVAVRQEATLSGDEDAIKVANKQMAYDIGINAAKVGNLDLALDGLDQLKNLSEEERKQYGVDDDFITNIEETKKNIQLSAELWQDNHRRYGSESAESISIREFHLKNYNTELPNVKQRVDELINNLPRIGEITVHGKNAMEAKLNIQAAERTLKILNWKVNNQKMSSKAKETLNNQIEELRIQISSYKDAFDSTLTEFKKELNDADRLVLKTLDGKMGEDLTKAKSTQNLYNNQIHQLTEELNFLTSKEGQKAVQEELKRQADKVTKQKQKEEAQNKHEQEEQDLAGEETGPDMSISETDAMIKSGAINEELLDDKAKQALKDYRAGLIPDKNLQPEDETTETPEVNKNQEETRNVKEEIKNTSKASNTDGVFATPENAKGIEDLWFGDDKSLNVALKTPNALAWFSYYNTEAQDKDKTKANKALADFLEGPYNLKDVTIRFGIDFDYLEKYKNKDFPEIKNAIANKSIPQFVGQLPVYAILEKDGKPIIHEGEELRMHLHDDIYSNFDDSIKEITKAQIVDQKTQILKAHYEGKTLTSKVLSESNGHINVTYSENREMTKNSLKEISADPTKLEFIYGSNGFYLTPKGDPILDLPASKVSNGAIYAKVKTANGTNFPLRLHAENLSRDEAYVVYRLALEILKDSNKATENVSKDIIDGITNAKNPVLSQISSYMDLNNTTHKELLDHFVFNGYQKTKNTGDSKLYIIPQTTNGAGQVKPGKIVYGAKADYNLELFSTPTARDRFINHLQKNRRRQVDAKLLDNPEYKKYLVDNMILSSNAIANDKGRIFVQPTVTYDTNFTVANTTSETTTDSNVNDIEAKKADIERRRQEELFNALGNKEAYNKIKDLTKQELTGDVVKEIFKRLKNDVVILDFENGSVQLGENVNHIATLFTGTTIKGRRVTINKKSGIYDSNDSLIPLGNPIIGKNRGRTNVGKNNQESIYKEINAKYDAELATLKSSTIQKEETKIEEKKLEKPESLVDSNDIEDINTEEGTTIASLLGTNTPLTKTVNQEEAKKPEDTTDEVKKQRREEAKKRRKDGGDSAFKALTLTQIKEQYKRWNLVDNEVKHIRQLLPKAIGISIIADDYIEVLSKGQFAIGLFADNMITLAERGPKGVAYHEAFHAVFRTMLSEKGQSDILKDAVKYFEIPRPQEIEDIKKLYKVTNHQEALNLWYEEKLADEFERFMGEPQVQYPSLLRNLFERLKNWIKGVFSNTQTIKKLFRDIQLGKYRNKSVKISKGVAYKTLIALPTTNDTFSPEEIKEITQQLAFAALKDVKDINDLKNINKDTSEAKDMKSIFINNMKDELYNLIDISVQTNNIELEDRVNKVLGNDEKESNFTYFVNQVFSYLDLVMNLEESEELIEDNDGNLIPKSSYEVSGKINASKNIKFLIALTPRFKSYDIRTDKKEYDIQGTYLGLPRFSDFGNTWNKLEKNLAGIVPIMRNGTLIDSFDLMLEKLEKLSKYHPELGYISNTIRSKDNIVKTQFNFTFSRFKGNYLDHLISGNPGSMISKISNADSFRKEKAIANIWAVNMAKSLGVFQDQKLVYSPEKLEYLKNVYAEMRKSLAKDSLSGVPSKRTIDLLDGTLHLLGINIKPEALTKWVDDEQVPDETPQDKIQIAKITNFVLKLDKALIADKDNSIFNRRGDINGRLSDNKINNHILDQKFFHTELTAHAAEFEKISGESTIIGPNGNKIWIYQDNNLISKTISAIKAGDNTYLDLLAQTPYAQNSLWAKYLRDNKNAQKFDIDVYGNYKEEGIGDSGDKASDLKDPDKFNDIINKYLAGVYVGLAEADKSQQYYLTGPELQPSQVSINPSNGQPFYDNTSAKSVTILYNYFADEMNRMVHAYNQLNGEDKLKPEQQIMYYHFAKTPGDGKGNCFKSYLFPNMDLEAMGLLTNGIPKTLTPNNQNVRRYIESAFLELVKRDLQKASEFGIIAKDGANYRNRTIDSNLILNKYNGNVGKAIADYTLNSIIANVEQTKLFNGDPALYKSKGDGFEDFRKRIPAAIASGKDIRIFKDDKYEVRSHYTSAVIENIETPSNYFSNEDNLKHISEITKLPLNKVRELFKPYLSVNQTDAQAWITLDAYRERMVGYGKWSSKHEDAYNRIKVFKMLPEDVTLFAQPVKTVHAEMKYQNGVMSMQYNKQSEAVLLPDVVKGLKIEKLAKVMQAQKVDHVIVLDGKKAGAIGVTKITDDKNDILDDIKLNGVLLSYRHLMLQQDLPTKRIKDTMVGSQPTKNVLAVLDFAKQYGDQNGQQVFEEYHSTISKLSDMGLIKVHKEFGYNANTGKKDLKQLYKTLERLFKGEVSNNISNAFRGKLPVEAIPQIRKRIQNKINSFITKKTVKLKQLGGAMIQLSNFGWITSEANIKLDDTVKDGIIWFKSPNSELNPARLKDGKFKAAQILIPHSAIIDTFNLMKKNGLIKKSYKEMSHNELKALISPEVLKGLSYRIPNQGPASNDVFDIVGILPPEMGDTMIAFKEITTKTGSDFDIDKAFIILPNFRYDESVNKIVKVAGTDEQGLQNRRLELMQTMLSHPEVYAQMMAPLDDPWLKDLCTELFPEENKAKDLNFFTGTSQMETKSLFDNAKNLVGVIANHMSHHNLTKHDGLYYNDYYLGKGPKVKVNSIEDKNAEDFNPSEFTNYSGAAIGGDKYWESIGKNYKIGKQVNYRPEDLSKLTKEQLEETEIAYKKAVKDLGRKELEKGTFAGGLVRRDYLQAKAADTIFAISAIVKPGEKDKKGYINKTKNEIVEGGTGYAVQMGINLGKKVYVFDQNKKQWFKAEKQTIDLFEKEESVIFIPIETPILDKKFAGIGTRELNESGKKAIENVYAKSFSSIAKLNPSESNQSLVSTELDEDNNLVEITLGAYMNAIVDAAKDPFISRANINQFTAPTAFMLTRAGLSREWITAFIGQPILKELVEEINKTEGRISETLRDQNGRIVTALDKVLQKYGYTENSTVFKSKLKANKFADVNKVSYKDLKNSIKGTTDVPQLQVLAQFLEWQGKAKELNDLIKACKADTNGATKNLTSARLQDNLLKKLVRANTFGNLDRLVGYTLKDGEIEFNGTRMTGTYHKNSINAAQEMFEDTFMTESPAFLTSMYTIAQSAGYPFLQDVQLADTINDELYAAIASESSIFYSTKEEINKLLYGKGAPIKWGEVTPNTLSLADRVLQAKEIAEFKDNLFIQSLDVRPGFNNQPSLVYLSPKNLDKDAKDNMFLAWEDVLELDKQLGEDLIRYAYYSSGFKNSFGTFYEHIPVSWMVQSGYSDFISQKMNALSNPQETAGKESQILKHLYENNELVQHAPQSLIKDIDNIERQWAFGLNISENPNLAIGFNANGKTEIKRFLKIVIPIRNEVGLIVDSKTNLYKLAGYSNDQAIYVRTNKLGYSKGGLIIKEYGGDGNVSIFEENNVTLPEEVESLLGENLVFPEPIQTEYTVIEKKQKPDDETGEDYMICKNRE